MSDPWTEKLRDYEDGLEGLKDAYNDMKKESMPETLTIGLLLALAKIQLDTLRVLSDIHDAVDRGGT